MMELPRPLAERFPGDVPLLLRAAGWHGAPPEETFRQGGIEVATAACYLRLHGQSDNQRFHQHVWTGPTGAQPVRRLRIGLVPGAFYREHAGTGADGERLLRLLHASGHPAERIPISSFGRTASNAQLIRDWLAHGGADGSVLLSLSKGACDVKSALADPAAAARTRGLAQFERARVGHPARRLAAAPTVALGSHLAAAQAARPLHHDAARSAARPGRCALALALLPEQPPAGPYPGMSTHDHLRHPWAHRGHRRLAHLGPNDGGGVLLRDIERWPGLVYPVWGADHYMQPDWDLDAELTRVFQAFLSRCV
jgi:hypothetical protein